MSEDFGAYLNVKNAIMPAFSKDGKQLVFLTDITGTYQVWGLEVGRWGSWAHQLTFFEDRVTGIYPNPAGSSFVISRDKEGDEKDQFFLLEGNFEEGVRVTPLVNTPEYKNNFGAWRSDGGAISFSSNRRHPAFFDVYVQEMGNEPESVFQRDDNYYVDAWSGDGQYILLHRSNTNLDLDLLLLDLHNLSEPPRLLTPHEGTVYFSDCQFSPDGSVIYMLTNSGRNFLAPAKLEVATGKISLIADRPLDCEALSLSPDGTRLVYEVNEEGYSRLFMHDLERGEEVEIKNLPRGVALGVGLFESKLAWSPDGRYLAFSFNSPVHNADIWVYDRVEKGLEKVTFSPRGGLNFSDFVQAEIIHYPTFDGLNIPALFYVPKGTTKPAKLPFIVIVHGGPEGQSRFTWNPVVQFYLSQGYGVLLPNVRGSSGYGKEYLALDDIEKRGDAVADLKYLVEWLANCGYCDPKRIAVYGQSYGGFMVLAAVTTYPELWAAGVDIYGIGDMLTFLENTSSYRLKLRSCEYGDPVRDKDFLIELSPIHKIERITAPLMVIHGERDPRVPFSESEQMVKALKERNQPVEFLIMPDEGHGISRLKNKLTVYPAVIKFLDKHLKE
jgi:dipeptidyl aminopeptidase/acylaminoacyl peptidase